MGFVQAVESGFNNFFVATGRATRSQYWWYWLCLFIISGVLSVIGGFNEAVRGTEQTWIGVILQVISLVLGISIICCGIRRLHDSGRSGWNLCWGLIPLVGTIIVIVLLCKPSDPAPNRYGVPVYNN